jgi:Copper transport outer membrane protein, MctB
VIDFRYHLVSIIAIFLALAVGLLVGATTLTGPTETALKGAEHVLSQQNAGLRARNSLLNQENNANQAFAQAGSTRLAGGLLTGEKVVLVVPPGTDSGLTSNVTSALQQAGATVTGKILLQSSFFVFSGPTETALTQLAQTLAPQAGVKLTPPTSSTVAGQQEAAQVLAATILTKDLALTGLAPATSKSILSQLAGGGYVQVTPTTGNVLAPANLAVLLTPASVSGSSAQATATNQALVAIANEALAPASHGTVMAGGLSAVGSGSSAISMEGGSGPASTVDYADTNAGGIMVAQALSLLLRNKAPAAYGVGPGTAPSPAPTPTASPSTSTPATKGTK